MKKRKQKKNKHRTTINPQDEVVPGIYAKRSTPTASTLLSERKSHVICIRQSHSFKEKSVQHPPSAVQNQVKLEELATIQDCFRLHINPDTQAISKKVMKKRRVRSRMKLRRRSSVIVRLVWQYRRFSASDVTKKKKLFSKESSKPFSRVFRNQN